MTARAFPPSRTRPMLDKLSHKLYGITLSNAHAQCLCVRCKRTPSLDTYGGPELREYAQSGLCSTCFDDITHPPSAPSTPLRAISLPAPLPED